MKVAFLIPAILVAAAMPAHAQIYKWVDADGRTHYSDKAPEPGKKAEALPDRVSVYTSDPALVARAAATPPANPAIEDRVDSLERQLQYERMARQQAELAAYSQAQAAYPPYYPVPIAAPIGKHHGRRDGFRPANGGTGVVGPGIMPGTYNGPNAITAGNFTWRTNLAAPRGRGASF